MGKHIIYLIILSFIGQLNAQNKTSKKFFALDQIETISINTDKIFELKITNSSDAYIRLEANMEGEYYQVLELNTETKNKKLSISCDLAKDFQKPNDKLSAHKVYAVTLEIQVPKNIKVELRGDNTQVLVEGNYKRFLAFQTSGNYTLKNFRAHAKIQTVKGNISIQDTTADKKLQQLQAKLQELIYYKGGKKIESKTGSGFISYSVCKD